jgi:hypothetical protein
MKICSKKQPQACSQTVEVDDSSKDAILHYYIPKYAHLDIDYHNALFYFVTIEEHILYTNAEKQLS